jgi:uncharacterized protein YndB with AHSA1/START domain
MSVTERTINASVEKVFSILADGWSYSDWVVGTAHVHAVDDEWPSPGSNIYVKTGGWPLTLRGHTPVLECEPPKRLVLRPRLWPVGELTVAIDLIPRSDNTTRVVLKEQITGGPAIAARNKVNDVVFHFRNVEALRRLADLAERRVNSAGRQPQ